MNTKTFSYFIGIIGVILLSVGIAMFLLNEAIPPIAFDPSRSEQTIFGRNDLANAMKTREANREIDRENAIRADRRNTGVFISLGGGIILIVGIGLFISSNKKDDSMKNRNG